ncbi:MAG: radical SAM protein [Nitrospirota bacterium]
MPNILLINPWIYDFVAYDLWSKPLGLLYLAGLFQKCGCQVSLIDCLDRYHPSLPAINEKRYGCGQYYWEKVEKPLLYQHIPRRYKRYGLPLDVFKQELLCIQKPEIIFVTSMMTYWYPGVFKAIKILRECFGGTPIVLGGVYATLCYEHACKYSGADYVVKGKGEERCLKLIKELCKDSVEIPVEGKIYPAYNLFRCLKYVSMLTSYGCPYQCTYCASSQLHPGFTQREPSMVIDEIEYYIQAFGVKHIAFYDDALLVNAQRHICIILEEVLRKGLNCYFHTPNGLHVRFIDKGLADLLYKANFKTIRLSLETSIENLQLRTGGKVCNLEFEQAILNLKEAGYNPYEIEVYVMCGLPGQKDTDVLESINYVARQGVMVRLVEFSPIPGTKEWLRAVTEFGFAPDVDPLLHNNSALPFQARESYQQLKNLVTAVNSRRLIS